MRLESITLNNYRQYYGESTLSFEKRDNKLDLHVILGMNGTGKTNVLNGITWCLYNREFHLGDIKSAQEIINSQFVDDCIRRSIPTGEVSAKVQLVSDDGRKVIFERKKIFIFSEGRAIDQKDEFTVTETDLFGEWAIKTSEEDTQEAVTRYVPEQIHEYIFFDGEHLEHYFNNADNIKNGIVELTQAALLRKADAAFQKYVKTELEPKLKSGSDSEISNLQKQIDEKKEALVAQEKTIEEIQNNISNCKKNIENCSDIIKGHNDVRDKALELEGIEKEIDSLLERKKQKMKELMTFSRDYYIYLSFYPIVKQYQDFILSKEKEGHLPPKIDKSMLMQCLEEHRCSVCGSQLNHDSLKKVEELIERLALATSTANELSKALVAIRGFIEEVKKYPEKQKLLKSALTDFEKDIDSKTKNADRIRKYLLSIPDNESISNAIRAKSTWENELGKQNTKLGYENKQLDLINEDLQKLNEKLTQLLSSNQKYKSILSQKQYCERCSRILNEVRLEILNESRTDMQESTFRIFDSLIWKTDIFKQVEILDDFSLRLIDRFGKQSLGSCSAAERALLALSFTLALQEVSKHDSLLFIDTPIGRVDTENRKNFMQTLLELSRNKQVILTFTPSEYDAEVKSILGDRYGSFSTLVNKEGNTIINKS